MDVLPSVSLTRNAPKVAFAVVKISINSFSLIVTSLLAFIARSAQPSSFGYLKSLTYADGFPLRVFFPAVNPYPAPDEDSPHVVVFV